MYINKIVSRLDTVENIEKFKSKLVSGHCLKATLHLFLSKWIYRGIIVWEVTYIEKIIYREYWIFLPENIYKAPLSEKNQLWLVLVICAANKI